MFLNKIPVIRGWLTHWHNHSMRKTQTNAYSHLMRSIRHNPVAAIHFDKKGCVYSLEDGRSFYFNPDKSAGWLYSVPYTGSFETKETEFVRHTIKKNWQCLDIGACFGWYTVLLSQLVGDGGQIHAFEPVPDNRECLQENLLLNECSNVEINTFALGDQPKKTQIYVPFDGVSGSLKAHANLAKCQVVDIDVSTVDQYVAANGLNRLDFIKADIEGAEFLMLQGAQDALQRYRPMLMLEIQSHSTELFGYLPDAVFDFLLDLGYLGFYVTKDGNLEPYNLDKHHQLPDYNFIFRHKDKVA